MKLGLKALVIAMVMALAAIPAASANNGHGGGKPSWAGGGGGKPSWAGEGKPSWAGSGHADTTKAPHESKPKKAKAKHHEAVASDEAGSTDDQQPADLDGLNPARYCKALRDQMTELESDFAAMFGTNPNHANAFGKCVSRRAHGEDLSGSAGGDDSQGEDNPCETTEPPASEGTETGAEDGIETTASEDEVAGDQGSDDEATQAEDCSGDSASDDPADDGQGQDDDEQGEDVGEEDGGTVDEADSSDLGTVLRFLRL
jgi:hypothetical protein